MRHALIAALAGAVFFTCSAPREDELECEEAVAHLEQCCPALDVRLISCTYDNSGCGPTYPAIAIPEAKCIRHEGCDELVATQVCTRAQEDAGASKVCP
jgi:hypothetical protein